jgi:carbonic anhydrase
MTQDFPLVRTGETVITPAAAIDELFSGNRRFVTGTRIHPNQDAERRAALISGQQPFAVILGCSDSRLAAEIIFDRGLGDLFLVRTAGQALGPEVLGSIEYAVTVLRTPLVVVLGHDSCGAVEAAYRAVADGSTPGGHLGAIVDAVVPSVRAAAAEGIRDLNGIGHVHVRRTVGLLLDQSPILADAVAGGQCAVLGLAYQLTDGEVRVITDGDRRATTADPESAAAA